MLPDRSPPPAADAPRPEPAEDRLRPVALAAAAGDARAIRELFVALAPSLLGVARGVLGPTHPDLEDVVQNALVQTLRSLPSFRGDCRVTHFAGRITVHVAIDHARQLRARARAEQESARRAQLEATVDWQGSDQSLLVRVLLDELTSVQAETLILRAVLECTIEEVARATGAPENTVRSRLRLAKTALKNRLESDPGARRLVPRFEGKDAPHG